MADFKVGDIIVLKKEFSGHGFHMKARVDYTDSCLLTGTILELEGDTNRNYKVGGPTGLWGVSYFKLYDPFNDLLEALNDLEDGKV